MTNSSLLKKLLGVNGLVVDEVEFEGSETGEQMIVQGHVTKHEQKRCPVCGQKSPLYDQGRGARRWRTLDMGNSMKVFIQADAPRIECRKHGVLVQRIPWARPASRYTKSFEETLVWLCLHLSRQAVAEYLRVSWDTVGPVMTRVEKELSAKHNPYDHLVNIGIDETSHKKGHKYITVVVDHDTNRVVWIGKGYGKEVLEQFFTMLMPEQKKNIQHVSGDGAGWIRDTVAEHCPQAIFCIDPFHVVSWVTDVLDKVRRQEWSKARDQLARENKGKPKANRGRPKDGSSHKSKAQLAVETLKSAKYPLLMNPDHLSHTYQTKLAQVLLHNKRLATAYRLKEDLRLVFTLPPDDVKPALMKWRRRAWSSRNNLLVDLQRKIKRHTESIVAAITYGFSNARIEATNNKIKLSIRMAFGFRNLDNLISLILLRCGGLPVALPGRSA